MFILLWFYISIEPSITEEENTALASFVAQRQHIAC